MNKVRAIVGVIGEVVLTLGVLVLLFVVWQIGWNGMVEGRAQTDRVLALERTWGGGAGSGTTPPAGPTTVQHAPPEGEAFAIMRIPRLGADWAKPVFEGTALSILKDGLGHYRMSQMPGELGNFAVAGHRSGSGNPLIDIDQVKTGDKVIVETRATYFVYTVYKDEIVSPRNTSVLEPMPERPGVMPDNRYLVITTCHPRWGNSERWIVFAKLTAHYPRAAGLPPAELAVA